MSKAPLPPLGEEIAEHVERFCRRRGVDPAGAQKEGGQIAELMLTIFAGQKIRFPKEPFRSRELAERNKRIRLKFNGKNARELGVQFGLTRRQVWNIVKSDASTSSRSG